MSELASKTIGELRSLLDSGECSSREIVQDVADRIQAVDTEVNAYLEVDVESGLAAADVADQQRADGASGSLLGIPVAMKDLLNVKGQSCRCASKLLEGYTSPYDATCVAKVKEAGGIPFGRVNMDEFAMGASTEHSAFGVTKNPWNLDHVSGGSSGGSAAAVAADEAIVSLGSDTGGSVRQPASFCGCVGLKPGYGRVSRFGLTAFASSLDQVGVLSKTVTDAADTLQVIAGHDPQDTTSDPESVPNYAAALGEDLKGMKIGIAEEFFGAGVRADVADRVRKAIDQCVNLGAEPVSVSFPHLDYAVSVYYILAPAEASANLSRFDGIRYGNRVEAEDPVTLMKKTRDAGFGDEVKRRILLGTYVLSSGYYDAYYVKALKARALIKQDFDHVFAKCDVLMSPVAPTPAYRIGQGEEDPMALYLGDILTIPANLSGGCGLSVPCGFSEDGLPVGLQILGPALAEEKLLRAGYAYEQASNWVAQKPELKMG